MNNPFSKNHESTDQSVWADWLSSDSSGHTTGPKPLDVSKGRRKENVPRFSLPPKQSAQPRSPQTVLDTTKFQDEQMRAFLRKQPKETQKQKKIAHPKQVQRKEIAVSISLPDISLSRVKGWRLSPKLIKRMAIVAGLVLVVGLMVLTPKIINSNDKKASESSAGGAKNIPKSFAELTPEDAVNVTNERYDASRGFYSFNDKYGGGNVTVTEQQLPDNVRGNAEKGKQLAQSVGATDDYETTNGMLYLTLSDTKTAQRAVLLHRQLLIFIQSTEPMPPTAWVDYVQSLQ